MTNKEAIEAIKRNYPPRNYTFLREALDKAMETLEHTEWNLCSRLQNGRVTDLLVRDYIEELIAWMPLPEPYKEVL